MNFYASDYFEKLYDFAVTLIKKGLAYVDDSTSEEIAKQKVHQPRPEPTVLTATEA